MNHIYLFIACFFTSFIGMRAQLPYPSQVEESLSKAGSNRASLENVLKHYQKDKERYAAACYLIANMSMHSIVRLGG